MSAFFHADTLPVDKAEPSPEVSNLPCSVHAPGEATARRVGGDAKVLLHAAGKKVRHPRWPGVANTRRRNDDDMRGGSTGERHECRGDRAVQSDSALKNETAAGRTMRRRSLALCRSGGDDSGDHRNDG